MKLPPFSYLEPESLEEVIDLLSTYRTKARIMAGGTDLVPLLKKRLLAPQLIISLRRAKSLRGLQKRRSALEVGACTTLRELVTDQFVGSVFSALHEAAASVAAPPIQNAASLAGNILQNTRCLYYNQSELFRGGLESCYKTGGALCHAVRGSKKCFSVYQGDVAPALVALSAQAEVVAKGSHRLVPAENLFSGKGKKPITLKSDEMVTRIHVPLPAMRTASSYEKLRLRGAIDYPLVSCAVSLSMENDGRISTVRVVLGACGPAPRLLQNSALALVGTSGEPDVVEQAAEVAAKSIVLANNTGVPADYRRRMVPVVVRRAITRALNAARKDN